MTRMSLAGLVSLVLLWAPGVASAKSAAPVRLDAYSPSRLQATPSVRTPQSLTTGKLYVASVQGTVSDYGAMNWLIPQMPFEHVCGQPEKAPMFPSAGGSGKVSADAQFVFSYMSGTPCAQLVPEQWTDFEANPGSGWGHPTVITTEPLTAPTTNHLYDYALIGAGQPAAFRLLDPDTRDNYGSFEISVRLAAPSDCDGSGYAAFGLPSLSACMAEATGAEPLPTVSRPPVAINQTPISRVLRNNDVPAATNLLLPSGALDAAQFAAQETSDARAARSASRSLSAKGLISSAVSGYFQKGKPTLTSTAALYRSPAGARAGLQTEVTLARDKRPRGVRVSFAGIRQPAIGEAVTFTPRTRGDPGGVELVVRKGRYVETLRAINSSSRVPRAAATALLRKVLRHG